MVSNWAEFDFFVVLITFSAPQTQISPMEHCYSLVLIVRAVGPKNFPPNSCTIFSF